VRLPWAAAYPVTELWGTVTFSPVGAGCVSPAARDLTPPRVGRHIRRAAESGFGFNAFLDAACLGNREYDAAVKDRMLDHLGWLTDQGASLVTVSSGFLLELVKTHFPHLKVVVSSNGFVDTVEKARWFEKLGADAFTIALDANRDFELLGALRGAVRGELRLVVNRMCAYQCPYALFHALFASHASTSRAYAGWSPPFENGFLGAAETVIKSRWIRPEDLGVYQAMGYETYVIFGRTPSSEWLLRAVGAYAAEHYPGNLLDLLDGPCRDHIDPAAVLDNQRLGGFLEHFRAIDCRHLCHDCDYCRKVAREALSLKGTAG